jgi:hypothetical protein
MQSKSNSQLEQINSELNRLWNQLDRVKPQSDWTEHFYSEQYLLAAYLLVEGD